MLKKTKQGQSTIEFMLVFTAIVFVLIVFLNPAKGKFKDTMNKVYEDTLTTLDGTGKTYQNALRTGYIPGYNNDFASPDPTYMHAYAQSPELLWLRDNGYDMAMIWGEAIPTDEQLATFRHPEEWLFLDDETQTAYYVGDGFTECVVGECIEGEDNPTMEAWGRSTDGQWYPENE